jgi:hypothetical protein
VAGTGAELHFLSADAVDSAGDGSRPGAPAHEDADGVAALLRAPAAAL